VQQAKSNSALFLLFAAIAICALLGAGTVLAVQWNDWGIVGMGLLALVVLLSAMYVRSSSNVPDATAAKSLEHAAALAERVEQISVLLNVISEQQLLSDRAKSVAFRDKDSEALRRAIREEIGKQNYDGAIVLADDMERTFGYKAEAEQFRAEVQERRDERLRKQVVEAMGGVDKLVREERWAEAIREADRLKERLPKEVEMRREAHKKQLIVEWNDAVKRHDTDSSIEILKKLDLYLTPAEAESMQESVRGVFKDKLNALRTQFSLAVQDHHWHEALRLGETITRDFPNTRIATEVKESMQALRKHADEEPETAAASRA
jgi:hypothetical protein